METANKQSGEVCPECQTTITASQYVFNKKFMKVKCKGCGAEYKYDAPVWLVIVLIMIGIGIGLVPLLILWLARDLSVGVLWSIAYIFVAFVVVSYIEARYVQSNYSLNKC
jgi:uncharacterized protein (DUF983 family)